jgi:heat-inducible transcriptional repressor
MTVDVSNLPELTERQERILAMIVREYTHKPEPVGSKFLSENFLPNMSSATIRNDMARLEELGLLSAPHTSAGRIPTEAGYRYFVKRLMVEDERQLPVEEKRSIAKEFQNVPNGLEGWMRLAVVTLARTSRGAAVVTPPRSVVNLYKHLALISTHAQMVMLVLVLQGGDVRQQMLTLANALPQEALSAVANHLNSTCEGLNGEQVRTRGRMLENELEREILEVIADILDTADGHQLALTYRDGLSDVLLEFGDNEGAQQALRIMEERTVLHNILTEALDQEIGRVQVVIAGDGRWEEVRHLSIVLSHYGVQGQALGTLVVFGPTRMRYGRAISAVGYVAGLISHLMIGAYGYGEQPT